MHVRFDEDFVEEAVFLCASGRRRGAPALQVRRFHGEREKLYALLDPDERNAAFFRLHLEWFREWGLEAQLSQILAEFPLIMSGLKLLAFRKTRAKSEEGAELYVNAAGDRHGVVALRIERYVQEAAMTEFLRHELMHVHDMVDPGFGYSKRLPGAGPSQQRIIRERYRLLWDVTIDGRLDRIGRAAAGSRASRAAEFGRAYSFWPEEKRLRVFEELWTEVEPRHDPLMVLASDPRDLRSAPAPLPGGACPLCGFTTFQWADVPSLEPETLAAIQSAFPEWESEAGACGRCVEVYQSSRNLTPTILPD